MKKYKKNLLMLSAFFIMLTLLPDVTNAQPDVTTDTSDPDAPIDGGVTFLIAAGIGYGIKKTLNNKNQKNTTSLL